MLNAPRKDALSPKIKKREIIILNCIVGSKNVKPLSVVTTERRVDSLSCQGLVVSVNKMKMPTVANKCAVCRHISRHDVHKINVTNVM